jgi:predicted transport protein
MYENEDKTCSQFFITTAEKVLYLYEIAVEEEITNINNPIDVANQEIAVTTVPETVEPAETIETVESGENIAYVTYKKSYTARLIQAEETLKNNYVIIKQELLAYKKVKARTSWNAETFSAGRIQCAKLTVRGKTLWLNLNLTPNNYVDGKYSIVDCSDKKKFAEVPVAVKIRSNRSVKYALDLIRDMMSGLGIIRTDKQQEVIALPYEDTESLIKKGFIKEIYLGKTDKNTSVVKLNVGKMLKHKTENKD